MRWMSLFSDFWDSGNYSDFYDYGYGWDSVSGVIGAVVAVIAIILLFVLAIGIIWYLLRSAALYRIAKNRCMESAWMAWIPFFRTYLMGEIVGVLLL